MEKIETSAQTALRRYETLRIELIVLDTVDIVRTSGGKEDDKGTWDIF